MSIKVDIDASGAQAMIRNAAGLGHAGVNKLLNELAALQVRNIHQRVRFGVDASDKKLAVSKKIKIGLGGTTLVVTGNMIGAMRATPAAMGAAVIQAGSALEGKKWLWAQYGTRPHKISAKNKRALGWKDKAGGGKGKRKSMSFARWVHHPGTPPRPAFGISPVDLTKLNAHAQVFLTRWMGRKGSSAA